MNIKANISQDNEWYPVYLLGRGHSYDEVEIEVEKEVYERWKRVIEDFIDIQSELKKLYEAEVSK